MDASRRFVSVMDAAQRLGISRITAYRWAESGRLPSVKLGARRLVPEAALDRLLSVALGEEASA